MSEKRIEIAKVIGSWLLSSQLPNEFFNQSFDEQIKYIEDNITEEALGMGSDFIRDFILTASEKITNL